MENELIRRLEHLQAAEGLSDRAFAIKLGITNGQWSGVRRGDRLIGRKTLRAIVRRYPGLEPLAREYWNAQFEANIAAIA